MSSRLAKSPRSFPLQDKVALAYLHLTITEVSPGSGSQSHLMGFLFFSRTTWFWQTEWGFKLNMLTLDLDAILHFIHWSPSVSLKLRSGEIFSHSVQLCAANRRWVDILRVNHYHCTEQTRHPLLPSSILPLLPPSLFHTVTSTLPHTPFFFYCVSFFTHLKYQGLLLRKHHTIHGVHKHTLT